MIVPVGLPLLSAIFLITFCPAAERLDKLELTTESTVKGSKDVILPVESLVNFAKGIHSYGFITAPSDKTWLGKFVSGLYQSVGSVTVGFVLEQT